MKNLCFIKSNDELYDLADKINGTNPTHCISKKAIDKIIDHGLANRVLNVIPRKVGIVRKYGDPITNSIKEPSTFIHIPAWSAVWIYAIPKCNYRFELVNVFSNLSIVESSNDTAIILDPAWGGYQVYKYASVL